MPENNSHSFSTCFCGNIWIGISSVVLLGYAGLISTGLAHVPASVAGAAWSKMTSARKAHPSSTHRSPSRRPAWMFRMVTAEFQEAKRSMQGLLKSELGTSTHRFCHILLGTENHKTGPDSRGEKILCLLMGRAAMNCGCFRNPPRRAFGSFQFSAKMNKPAVNILAHVFR